VQGDLVVVGVEGRRLGLRREAQHELAARRADRDLVDQPGQVGVERRYARGRDEAAA
jgi:hypothetical protein